jgi:hypothetical protein
MKLSTSTALGNTSIYEPTHSYRLLLHWREHEGRGYDAHRTTQEITQNEEFGVMRQRLGWGLAAREKY